MSSMDCFSVVTATPHTKGVQAAMAAAGIKGRWEDLQSQ